MLILITTTWKQFVFDSIISGIEKGELSIEQKRGVLTLIPKKDKDIRRLKNWRPISLLNSDYKIFAKLLASRLQKVLPAIISSEQSGYLKGRFIGNNIRNILDVLEYTKSLNLPGMIIFLDFEKAFDTEKWDFMLKCLEKFNFGDYFKKCIATLYKKILTCVTNNGHSSLFFQPERGIRQGCPTSALLFLLVVEVLATSIKANKRIQGIQIGDKEFKITQLADDTTLFISDTDSLGILMQTIDIYKKCSGLRVNRDKSEAIWIGASSNFRHKPLGLKWTSGLVKCLGVWIGTNRAEVIKVNFAERIQKLENLLKMWLCRNLSLKGKITVIQSLAIPQLLYTCSALYVPEDTITKVHNILINFLWNNKKAKIKYSTVIGKLEEGGLKMPDFKAKVMSLKMAWIQRLYENSEQAWKNYLKFISGVPISLLPFFKSSVSLLSDTCSPFYRQLFTFWKNLYVTPNSVKEVQDLYRQLLWHNDDILVDKHTVYYKRWVEHKILSISDIVKDNGSFYTCEDIRVKYDINIHFMEYFSLMGAIPHAWKKMLRESDFSPVLHNIDLRTGPEIKINDVYRNVCDLKCRDIYWCFVQSKFVTPTCELKWCEKHGYNFSPEIWQHVYLLPYKICRNAFLQSFQTKIIHRILPCKEVLFNWKIKDSNVCSFCNNDMVDDIPHYFVLCETFLAKQWWQKITGTLIKLDTCELLFGVLNLSDDMFINQLNYILLLSRKFIHECKKSEKPLYFQHYLQALKQTIETEKYIMYKNGKIDEFTKQWSMLYIGL